MDYPERDDLLARVTLMLVANYQFVIKVLQGLPLPIQVPATVPDRYSVELEESLTAALNILADIPMDPVYRGQVRVLVIDWITAADYLEDARQMFEVWKVDFVITQLSRVGSRWEVIQGMRDTLE